MTRTNLITLLAERRRLRALCATYCSSRTLGHRIRAEDDERQIAALVAERLDVPRASIPGAPALTQVVFAVLLAFNTLERLDRPITAFDRLGVAVYTRDWHPTVIARILELAGPLDNVLLEAP